MSSFPSSDLDADVIIVGAGISGMVAAFRILQYDPSINILILEATNCIGGRTLSLPLKVGRKNYSTQGFDFGGQFLSTNQLYLMNLLNDLNLEIIQKPYKDDKIIWDLEQDSNQFMSKTLQDFKQLEEWTELLEFFKMIRHLSRDVKFDDPHSTDNNLQLDFTTMEEFIIKYLKKAISQNLIRHMIHVSCGVKASEMSVLFYLAFCNCTKGIEEQLLINDSQNLAWIKGGADQICQKIAALIGNQFIKTNCAALEISWDANEIVVETEYDIFCSRYVIIAIPPPAISQITFDPPIKEHRWNIINNMNKGHFIKFVVTYTTEFWKDQGYSGVIISNRKANKKNYIKWCYNITTNDCPALVGYFSCPDLTEHLNTTYRSEVLVQLAKYFGNDALHPLDYLEKNWLQNEESPIHNCFTNCPKLGNMNNYSALRLPLGRIYWAGTEAAIHGNGYMEGAVQAGHRAATELLYDFRPQSIIFDDIQQIAVQ